MTFCTPLVYKSQDTVLDLEKVLENVCVVSYRNRNLVLNFPKVFF